MRTQLINGTAASATDPDMDLTTVQVARILGVTTTTLKNLRNRGGGPPFRRYGTRIIRYGSRDLAAWRAERTVK